MTPKRIPKRFKMAVRRHLMRGLETRPNFDSDPADIIAQFFRARRLEEGC